MGTKYFNPRMLPVVDALDPVVAVQEAGAAGDHAVARGGASAAGEWCAAMAYPGAVQQLLALASAPHLVLVADMPIGLAFRVVTKVHMDALVQVPAGVQVQARVTDVLLAQDVMKYNTKEPSRVVHLLPEVTAGTAASASAALLSGRAPTLRYLEETAVGQYGTLQARAFPDSDAWLPFGTIPAPLSTPLAVAIAAARAAARAPPLFVTPADAPYLHAPVPLPRTGATVVALAAAVGAVGALPAGAPPAAGLAAAGHAVAALAAAAGEWQRATAVPALSRTDHDALLAFVGDGLPAAVAALGGVLAGVQASMTAAAAAAAAETADNVAALGAVVALVGKFSERVRSLEAFLRRLPLPALPLPLPPPLPDSTPPRDRRAPAGSAFALQGGSPSPHWSPPRPARRAAAKLPPPPSSPSSPPPGNDALVALATPLTLTLPPWSLPALLLLLPLLLLLAAVGAAHVATDLRALLHL